MNRLSYQRPELIEVRWLGGRAALADPTWEADARSVGISVAALVRCQKKPEFQKTFRGARCAAFSEAIGDYDRCAERRPRLWRP
jgi:hypothetical protein